MRTHAPVTQQPFPLPEGVGLVYTTDVRGRITYCNPAFIALSDHRWTAGTGQPHPPTFHPGPGTEADSGASAGVLPPKEAVRLRWPGWMRHLTHDAPGCTMAAMTLTLVLVVLGMGYLSEGLPTGARLAVMGACAGLAVGAGFLMWRVMTAPVRELVRFANRMAAGHLSSRLDVSAQGELGELARVLNQIHVNL